MFFNTTNLRLSYYIFDKTKNTDLTRRCIEVFNLFSMNIHFGPIPLNCSQYSILSVPSEILTPGQNKHILYRMFGTRSSPNQGLQLSL